MVPLEKIIDSRGRGFLLRVETSARSDDYAKYEALRQEIWDFAEDHMSGTRNMMCENVFHEGASLFIGAFAEDPGGGFPLDAGHLAGFSYGFVGVRDKSLGFRVPANLWFYAQYTGVRRAFQSHNLGIKLKEFQRDIVRDLLGVPTIICTYDPLTGVNAHRNVHHFGMEVLEYREAIYGEYGGLLNRLDIPTDRFLMSWDLTREPGRHGLALSAVREASPVIRTGRRTIAGRTRVLELETVEGTDLGVAGELLRVPIPLDFYTMIQETDIADPATRRIPLDWRLATREVFQRLFAQGYRVVDFLKAEGPGSGNAYLLARTPSPR